MASPRPIIVHSGGFAYLALLITVAIIGVAAVATFQMGSILQRRAAEEELIAIGTEFRRALISYSSATPAGQPNYPPSLAALIKDPRYPNIRRHLRKLYYDPLTGTQKWGLVMSPDGKGIVGVYSLAQGKPIKIGNFETVYQGFTDKTSYADWVFTSIPPALAMPTGTVTMPGMLPGANTPAASSTGQPNNANTNTPSNPSNATNTNNASAP